jgi:hypothetical protein
LRFLLRQAVEPEWPQQKPDFFVLFGGHHRFALQLNRPGRDERAICAVCCPVKLAELLAAIYTTLQAALQLDPVALARVIQLAIVRVRPKPLPPRVTADDRNAHREFVRSLGSDPVWRDYFTIRSAAA